MSKLFLSLAALTAMMACAAAATPDPAAPAYVEAPAEDAEMVLAQAFEGLACDIRATATSHGVLLEAVAWGAPGVSASGLYDFVINKSDDAGSSDVNQGGAFDLVGAEPQALGVAEFSVAPRGGYRAHLILRDVGGGVLCDAEVRS